MLIVGGDNIKKILKLIILFLLVFLRHVDAKIYGIDYRPIEELDLKVEEIKKYHFYKENDIESYYIEGENPDGFIKQEDFFYSDYSEWFKEKPNVKNGREIKERQVYVYDKLRKIKKIYIEVDDDEASVLEFAIYFNGYIVNHSANCNDCSGGYYTYMKDNRFDRAVKIGTLFLTYEDYHNPPYFQQDF